MNESKSLNESKHEVGNPKFPQYARISRRAFLKGALAAGSALALAGCTEGETVTNTVTVTERVVETVTVTESEMSVMPASQRLEFNLEFCAGCATCELVCAVEHFGEFNKKLGALRMDADFHYHQFNMYLCRQCEAASCVTSCPVEAIKFDAQTGARYVVDEECIMCGRCVDACPLSDELYPPIHIEELDNGEEVLVKCDLCRGRAAGPACVEVCFYHALSLVG